MFVLIIYHVKTTQIQLTECILREDRFYILTPIDIILAQVCWFANACLHDISTHSFNVKT